MALCQIGAISCGGAVKPEKMMAEAMADVTACGGAVKPEKMMAEAMADVTACGKDASLFSHCVCKIHWALNSAGKRDPEPSSGGGS